MPRIPLFPALTIATFAGCASPQTTVRTALADAGLSPALSECMAGRMTDRLSVSQLQKLARARGAPGEKVSDLSAAELVERARRVDDPQVVAVVATAAAACSLAGSAAASIGSNAVL